MNQPTPIQSASATHAGAPAKSIAGPLDSGAAASFKALLDELDQRAQALEVESRKELSHDDLAGAVDNARVSLNQLLSLKDQLLEAWQAAQMQTPQAPGRAVA